LALKRLDVREANEPPHLFGADIDIDLYIHGWPPRG
jgi:hypothetical protein